MFKFATNKFTQGNHQHHSSSNQAATSGSSANAAAGAGGLDQSHAIKQHQNESSGGGIETNQSILTGMLGAGGSAAASKRRQLQKDLFAYNKIADKGFPAKPSAMDYDRKLKLIGIGTKNGDIRIYGAPLTAQQQLACYQDIHPFPILRLLFIQGQHQLITLTERVYRNEVSNKGESQLYLVLWQIPNNLNMSSNNNEYHHSVNSNLVEKIKEYALDAKIVSGTRLSALTLLNDNSHLFLGFESGDIYVFNVASFQIVPGVINKDYILKNLPDPATPAPASDTTSNSTSTSSTNTTTTAQTSSVHKKLTQLGAVESICHHPRQLTKLLLAYQRGLWVIFDFIKNQIDQINQTPQQLESAVFYQAGECVATSHLDGSFILWDLDTSSSTTPSTANSSPPNIVYGPYPCKPVTKCMVKTCRADQPYVIFSGGCPRVNYSDKITISVIQGENSHVCFDFTSKIIDFFTIDKPFVEKQAINPTLSTPTSTLSPQQTTTVTYDNPQALLVLLEEEFVAIDLVSEGWPQYRLPYLYSVHSSAVICTHYVNGVSSAFYDRLKQYGELAQDASDFYSTKDWPVTSTTTVSQSTSPTKEGGATPISTAKDLLLTGHEDGSVRFWDVTQMSMTLIYRLRTSDYFQTDSTPVDESCSNERANNPNSMSSAVSADNWPPFRKVGTFDPYSDDPKLGIQKIFLCPQRHVLVVAGTAGQVLIMNICEQSKDVPFSSIQAHKVNIIGVSPEVESHFVWKGHEPLALRGRLGNHFNSSSSANSRENSVITGSLKLTPGYQLHSLIQLYPPATVSALTLNTDWQLVGMGTSHGFALFDYLQYRDLLIRCTLDSTMLLAQNPNDSGNAGTTISRRKSLKKSLRESFRKLRRGRSQKPAAGQSQPQQQQNKHNKTMLLNNNTSQMRVEHIDDDMMGEHHKPIERQVESREFKPMDDIPPSVIRYMYFVRTFITSSQQQTNSLWVGTNTGVIYIYALQFLNSNQQLMGANNLQQHSSLKNTTTPCQVRTNQAINCLLAKEMRLKHRAPVVHIQVIDQNMHPLPMDATQSYESMAATMTPNDLAQNQNHKVIICSEEQFKVFQLPTLKPVCKFKLTAVEGARVRRIGYNCYTSRSDPKYNEYCLSCLSNLGDLSVYNLPQLKRQVQIQCMKQQDINAITSFVFSKQGQAFYLQSPSEFVHISMSARDSPQPFLALQAQNSQPQTPQHNTSQSKRNSLNNQQQQAKPKQSQQPPTTTTSNNNNLAKNSLAKNTASSASENESSSSSSQQVGQPPVPAPRTTLSNSNAAQAVQNSEVVINAALIPANRSTLKPSNLIESKPTQLVPQSTTTTSTTTTALTTTIDDTISSSSSKALLNETILASSTLNQINASMLSEFNVTTNQASNNMNVSTNVNGNNDELEKTDIANGSSITNVSHLTASFTNTTTPHLNTSNMTNITPIPIANSNAVSATPNNLLTPNSNNSATSSTNSSSNLNVTTIHNNNNNNNTNSSNTTTNNNNNNCNLINASSITSQSDVSFNMSSSGYNGSSILAAGTTSSNFGVDLSMDSVVDRYNDDFQDRSSKRLPLAVDESMSQGVGQNDSLLNDSEISDLSMGLLNKLSVNSYGSTNGHGHAQENGVNMNGQQNNCNQTKNNGQINFTYENDNEPKNASTLASAVSPKQQKTPMPSTPVSYQNGNGSAGSNGTQNRNGFKSPKTNGHSHIVADEEINMSPQKASSPMVKTNGNVSSNGHNGMNGTARNNKIEQVTKQIENGSKLEYRETAID